MTLATALFPALLVAAPVPADAATQQANAPTPELGDPLADPAASAPVQATPPPSPAPAPAELRDPLADPAATPAAAQAPATSATPELADPLADPAAAPAADTSAPLAASPTGTASTHAPGDPLEKFNRRMFRAHEKFDRKLFRPAAMGYKTAVPKPLRSGLRNAFSNIGEPVVFLNYVLQAKPGKAFETLGRFVINSTLGLGGLIDIAKSPGVRLPHRANGLGNTLALYGVKPGPYLFLPFVGPTTLRDLVGGQADGLVLPLAVGTPFDRIEYQIPRGAITGLDTRAEADDDLKALYAGAVDPYATLRSVYLQNRAGEIAQVRGSGKVRTQTPQLGEPLADPAGTQTPAADQSTTPELSDPLADPAGTSPASPKP